MRPPTSIPSIRRLSKNDVSVHIKRLKEIVPDFTTIWWWRVIRTKINLNPKVNLERDVVVAVDSTGIKVTNREENGYLINGIINEREKDLSKYICGSGHKDKENSINVCNKRGRSWWRKILKELVGDILSKNKNMQKVLADGAYDSKENFEYLDELKITPVIKVRKNSSIKTNTNCIPRKLSVLEQFKDIKRWKKKYGYGYRWMTESAFSSIKRTFGEHISSVKWDNIVNELMLKASLYNKFIENTTT